MPRTCLIFLFEVAMLGDTSGAEAIRLATNPALSPDGKRLAFAWAGDIWTVNANGSRVRRFGQKRSMSEAPT